MKETLTILLPAYNEESALGPLIAEIKEAVTFTGYDLLVIDNASTDRTCSIALNMGARVLPVELRGKGNAVRAGLQTISTPYVIMMNADKTYSPAYVKLLYAELVKGAEVVLGTRAFVDKGAMPFLHSIGNVCLSYIASTLFRVYVPDLCTGMWGFRTSVLQSFTLTSSHFSLEADLFINAVRQRAKIRTVPIAYRMRPNGDKPKLRVRDGFRIGWFLLCKRFGR